MFISEPVRMEFIIGLEDTHRCAWSSSTGEPANYPTI